MIQVDQVDIADFAMMEYVPEYFMLKWEEMRDIFALAIICSDKSALSKAKIQYWHRNWPHQRVPKGASLGAGGSGWMRDDDWFNGEWKDADTNLTFDDDKFIYTFNPINQKEFPNIGDFDAKYRRTMKIRLLFEGNDPKIKTINAYTDSIWKEMDVKIEWGNEFAEKNWKGNISVYNGKILDINYNAGYILLKIKYTYNEDINSFDKTIITVRNGLKSFSFLADEVVEKIFVKDFDVLVTKAEEKIDYNTFKKEWESNHAKTVYDMINDLPEQTYAKSWNDMPKKRSRGFMPLGCDGCRQKFGVDQNGDVFYPKNYVERVKGKDTDRLLWEGNWIRYSFGFPNVEPTERYIEEGYLPIIYARWEDNNISYEQKAFVTPLGQDILSDERLNGDDPTILLAKVTLKNLDEETRNVSLKLKAKCDIEEVLIERNGFVFATNYDTDRMRYFIDIAGNGEIISDNEGLSYNVTLMKNESHSIYFKIPFITLTEQSEFELVKDTDFEYELPRVRKFWNDRISTGTQIYTPNEILNNFYKSSSNTYAHY